MQYAVFGSVLTLGGMLGAVFSGKIADLVGRKAVNFLISFKNLYPLSWIECTWFSNFLDIFKQAMGISEIFCISGWLAIVFSKVCLAIVMKWMFFLRIISTFNWYFPMLNFCWKDAFWLDMGRFLVGCGSGVLVYVVIFS